MSDMTMHQVELTLTSTPALGQDTLEDLAEAVYDALVDEAKLVVLGPAVSVNLQTSSIELLFDVCAATPEELYVKISHAVRVLGSIDHASGFGLSQSRTVETHDTDRDLALA